MSISEQEWLRRAQNHDDEAFTYIVETYQKPVYNLCYRMLGNAQEAEDAAQEAFWRAYRAINRYDQKRSFATWLLSIAAHYCIDQHRRKRLPTFAMELLPEESVPFLAPGPEKQIVQTEEDRQIHRLLDELKPKDRAAIVLRYWYEFSEVEISETLNLSVSAVKSRLHRARKQLAQTHQAAQPKSQPQPVLKEVV